MLIAATLYVCYFSHLGALGFIGPDEPRYAWIARDMAETGDWVTPRLYDTPWFEKPPLYYWGAALSFKLFGESGHRERSLALVCASVSAKDTGSAKTDSEVRVSKLGCARKLGQAGGIQNGKP